MNVRKIVLYSLIATAVAFAVTPSANAVALPSILGCDLSLSGAVCPF